MSVLPVAVLLAGVALSGFAPIEARAVERSKDWLATLHAACPGKRLDYLNPGILIDEIEALRTRLPTRAQARIERLATSDLDRCEAGAGCVNSAYIRAAAAMNLMRRMAQAVCARPWTCTAPFTCRNGA